MSVVSCWSVRAAGWFLQPAARIRTRPKIAAAGRQNCVFGMNPCSIECLCSVKPGITLYVNRSHHIRLILAVLESSETCAVHRQSLLLARDQCAICFRVAPWPIRHLEDRHGCERACSDCDVRIDMDVL